MVLRFVLALALLVSSASALVVGSPRVVTRSGAASLSMGIATFRTGDKVQVITGADKGAVGKVISVDRKKGKVTVEGVNIRSKHMKPMKEGETGRIMKREVSIHISNVAAVDGDDDDAE